MRPLAAVLLLSLFCRFRPSSAVGAEREFPYTAVIIANDAYIRSGPGEDYYPTDRLKRGQQVEVYRHDPGGWCAVRPVEGSFAWVSGRHLKAAEDRLAVVTEDGAAARVGSRFSEIRDVIQVQLHKGEVVEVVDPPPRGGFGENAWFKIAPPSGEFRWVSAKYLRPDDFRGSLHKIAPKQSVKQTSGETAEPRKLTAEEYRAELERIELELTAMVIEEPTVWSFDSLRERTNVLLDQARTEVERGSARLLADKFARFDDIKQRYDEVLAMRRQTDHSSRLWAGLRPKDDANLQTDGRFDAVGKLTQVVSPKAGAPRYALTDDAGGVRCYVTPAPGVKLYDFVDRQVGMTGNRGYMPEQRASHIMARHVTPLEATTLR